MKKALSLPVSSDDVSRIEQRLFVTFCFSYHLTKNRTTVVVVLWNSLKPELKKKNFRLVNILSVILKFLFYDFYDDGCFHWTKQTITFDFLKIFFLIAENLGQRIKRTSSETARVLITKGVFDCGMCYPLIGQCDMSVKSFLFFLRAKVASSLYFWYGLFFIFIWYSVLRAMLIFRRLYVWTDSKQRHLYSDRIFCL